MPTTNNQVLFSHQQHITRLLGCFFTSFFVMVVGGCNPAFFIALQGLQPLQLPSRKALQAKGCKVVGL